MAKYERVRSRIASFPQLLCFGSVTPGVLFWISTRQSLNLSIPLETEGVHRECVILFLYLTTGAGTRLWGQIVPTGRKRRTGTEGVLLWKSTRQGLNLIIP